MSDWRADAATVLLNGKDAARLLGLTPAALSALRRTGDGPPGVRLFPRSHFHYRLHDVAVWAARMSVRAALALNTVMDAAARGEANHNTLREIAYDAADAGTAHFEALLRQKLVGPSTRTRH